MLLPAQLRQVTWLRPARTPSRPLTKCLSVCVRQRQIATGLLDARRSCISGSWDSFGCLKGASIDFVNGLLAQLPPPPIRANIYRGRIEARRACPR